MGALHVPLKPEGLTARRPVRFPDGWRGRKGSSLPRSLVVCRGDLRGRQPAMLLLDMHLLSAHWVCRSLSNCFRNVWSHLLPQRGVFFHYLKIVVYMNWDKHLVGRSFISWPFQFEFYYFCCLPGEGKNILSPRQMNHQITAPLQLVASAWNINCRQFWWWPWHLRGGGGGFLKYRSPSVWAGAIQRWVPTPLLLSLLPGWE